MNLLSGLHSRPRAQAAVVALWVVIWWALAVGGRLWLSGDVYGLDYRLLHPDGVCYTAHAFSLLGQGESGRLLMVQAYMSQGTPISLPIGDFWASGSCTGLESRILYPLTSAPFVSLFGVTGMLVVPALAWLISVMVPAVWLATRRHFFGALIISALMLSSTSLARWSVANITDALLMAVVALLIPVLLGRKLGPWTRALAVLGIVVVASLTRQSWPLLMLAGGAVIWHRLSSKAKGGRQRQGLLAAGMILVIAAPVAHFTIVSTLGQQNGSWIVGKLSTAVSSAIASTGSPDDPLEATPPAGSGLALGAQSEGSEVSEAVSSAIDSRESPDDPLEAAQDRHEQAESVSGSLRLLVEQSLRVPIVEFGQLGVLDRALLLLVGLGLLSSVVGWRRLEAKVTMSIFLATLAIGILNGTEGLNFRLQMASVPWLGLMAGLSVAFSWSLVKARNGRTKPTTPDATGPAQSRLF